MPISPAIAARIIHAAAIVPPLLPLSVGSVTDTAERVVEVVDDASEDAVAAATGVVVVTVVVAAEVVVSGAVVSSAKIMSIAWEIGRDETVVVSVLPDAAASVVPDAEEVTAPPVSGSMPQYSRMVSRFA